MADSGVPMAPEIVQGIFGGLAGIIVVVTIGSFIGSALSHGPEHAGGDHGEGTHQEAPAGEAAAGEAAGGEAAGGDQAEAGGTEDGGAAPAE